MEASKRKIGVFLRFVSSHVVPLHLAKTDFPKETEDLLQKKDVLKSSRRLKENREIRNHLLFGECSC